MSERSTRKIDDAGETIAGARKNFAKERLEAADLAGMTDVEMVESVQKEHVWPKPDYRALVADGMEPEAAALVKIIRDRVAKSPAVSRTRDHSVTLRWYVETLGAARDLFMACRTVTDVTNVYRQLERAIAKPEDRQYNISEGRYRLHVADKGRTVAFYANQIDIAKAKESVQAGFPDDQPVWRKGLVIRRFNGDADFVIAKRVGRQYQIVSRGFASEDDALDWLRKRHETAKASAAKASATNADEDGQLPIPDRPHLSRIRRENMPDWRGGEDVSPQTFIDVFGFWGVQFGDWLPQDERQTVLNMGYDALMDLSEATGLAPGQLSLEGTLALAFGARGNGGKHSAHYEPGLRVFNFTRLSGAGAVAHEFGHAFDQFLGTGTSFRMAVPSLTGWRDKVDLADTAAVLGHRGPGVVATGLAVRSAIALRDKTKEERVAELEKMVRAFERSVASWQAHVEKRAAVDSPRAMRKLHASLAKETRGLERVRAALAEAKRQPVGGSFGKVQSDYSVEAEKITGKGGYWARPNELFARAFEAFVEDAVEARGGVSQYLVYGTACSLYPPGEYRAQPYPTGEERVRLAGEFSALCGAAALVIEDVSRMAPLHLADAPSHVPEPMSQ